MKSGKKADLGRSKKESPNCHFTIRNTLNDDPTQGRRRDDSIPLM